MNNFYKASEHDGNRVTVSLSSLKKQFGLSNLKMKEDLCLFIRDETDGDPLRQAVPVIFSVNRSNGSTASTFAWPKQFKMPSVGNPTPKTVLAATYADRKSTRLNSSHTDISRMPSSA